MKISRNTLKVSIHLLIFYIILFQNALESKIKILSSLDEIVSVIIMLLAVGVVLKEKSIKLNKYNFKILVSLIILFILGMLSNYIYDYQMIKYSLYDFIIFSKGFGVFISSLILFRNLDIKIYKNMLNKQLKLISSVMFLLILLNLVIRIFPEGDVRYGIPTQQLFFSHQTYLASCCILIIALLTAFMRENKSNILNISLLFVVIVMTGRTKAIAMIPVYYIMYYIVVLKNKFIDLKRIVIIFGLISTLAYEKIITYFSNDDWARTALMKTSLTIAKDKFPFGSGCGTFASWISGKYYSRIYYEYGLDRVYGLSPTYHMYVADTFWPMVLGQFGIFGLFLVINILIQIYKIIKINRTKNIYYYLAQMIMFIYLIILSTAETSYTSPIAVIYFMIIAILSHTKITE